MIPPTRNGPDSYDETHVSSIAGICPAVADVLTLTVTNAHACT
jgi:hypothetical protein